MNAAVTARTRKRRKDSHSFLATRNRHLHLVASESPASAGGGDDEAKCSESAAATTRNPVPPRQDMEVAGCRGSLTITYATCGAFHVVSPVLDVDQSSVAPPTEGSEQARTTYVGQRPGRVDVHPPLRGKLDRLRRSILGGPADGPQLHGHLRPRLRAAVPRLRQRLARLGADHSSEASAGQWSGLQPVAEHGKDVRPARVDA